MSIQGSETDRTKLIKMNAINAMANKIISVYTIPTFLMYIGHQW